MVRCFTEIPRFQGGALKEPGPGDSGAEKHFAWQLAIKRDKWEIP